MTQRNPNYKIEMEGVRYVQSVVQDSHSIFQSIARENDQGNDCYFEFVEDGVATNYCVFVQIKSGNSYKDTNGYKIPADHGHLRYWSNAQHLNIGIVYDPDAKKAYWVDITAYLKQRPALLDQKHHAIRVDANNEFSHDSFAVFMEYCKSFRQRFSGLENFALALESFSRTDNPQQCYEGLKSLLSIHGERPATWHFITTNFRGIAQEGIRGTILGILSNSITSGDVLYSSSRLLDENRKAMVLEAVKRNFSRAEVEAVFPFIAEGIIRGSFSHRVYMVLTAVNDLPGILSQIAFDPSTSDESRMMWFWLYLHVQGKACAQQALTSHDQFIAAYPEAEEDEAIAGVRESIENGEWLAIG